MRDKVLTAIERLDQVLEEAKRILGPRQDRVARGANGERSLATPDLLRPPDQHAALIEAAPDSAAPLPAVIRP